MTKNGFIDISKLQKWIFIITLFHRRRGDNRVENLLRNLRVCEERGEGEG